MNWLRRLIDRWRHPEEYPVQRARRHYLAGIDMAQKVLPPLPELEPVKATMHEECHTVHLSWEACPAAEPPTVGARLFRAGPEGYEFSDNADHPVLRP